MSEVTQESVLGPILTTYLVFYQILAYFLLMTSKCTVVLMIISEEYNDIDNLEKWFEVWPSPFNISKCKSLYWDILTLFYGRYSHLTSH